MKKIFAVLASIVLLAMTSCGSGGGGSSDGHNSEPTTYSITGQIVFNNTGLAGVTVLLSGANTGQTTTDSNGHYSFTGLVNGNYTITPSLSDYIFSPSGTVITINGTDKAGIDFTATSSITPTYTISGTVSGAVASGVTITMTGTSTGSTTTDSSGNYSFSTLVNGNYTLTASKAGYSFSPIRSITVNSANVTGQNFTATANMPSTYTISGQVSGAVTSGVTITLTGTGSRSTTTDSNGNYIFSGAANGSYTILPSKTGYTFNPVSKSVTVNNINVTGQNFTSIVISPWTRKANLPIDGLSVAVGFSIGSKGYIGTGMVNSLCSKYFWEYDPATNIWTQKADFGGGVRGSAIGLSIGSKGYIGLGHDDSSFIRDFWEYDPYSNAWTQKTSFPGTAVQQSAVFSIGNKGYIGTGHWTSELWEYDPSTDIWTQKADFGGGARILAVGFSIGSKGYLGTGDAKADFWEYNPSTDIWTQKADFGGGVRSGAIGFSIGSKGYLGTGVDESVTRKDFWEYNPASNMWTQKSDVGSRYFVASSFSIVSKGYIGAGGGSAFWEYDPSLDK